MTKTEVLGPKNVSVSSILANDCYIIVIRDFRNIVLKLLPLLDKYCIGNASVYLSYFGRCC